MLQVRYVPAESNVADIFTKSLSTSKFITKPLVVEYPPPRRWVPESFEKFDPQNAFLHYTVELL